ncbi:hypothetical protein TNCV_2715101 [Trichonephila clavipes]|nr:hypothetical protein TNCV_2715101 [Trichonephila clavipes]
MNASSEKLYLLNSTSHQPGCKLPHDVAQNDKAFGWSPTVFLAKFAPIVGLGHQLSLVDAVTFPSYPRHARLKKDLVVWVAKEVFDKLPDRS